MTQKNEIQEVDVSPVMPLDIPMINMQVETANKYPRPSLNEITQNIEKTLKEQPEFAQLCFYKKPVGKDKDTGEMKYVEGASVRLAEFVASEYGNLVIQVGATETPTGVVANCRIFDAQKNVAVEVPVKRAFTSQRDQAKQNTYNAAVSIAYRNAIFKVVPKALAEKLFKSAKTATVGKSRNLKTRVNSMFEWFEGIGVSKEMLLGYLNVKEEGDIGKEKFVECCGLSTAIKNGDVDKHEIFDIKPESGGSKVNVRSNDDLPDDNDLSKAFKE